MAGLGGKRLSNVVKATKTDDSFQFAFILISYSKVHYSLSIYSLTLSHPEGLLWRVKSSGVRQSKITKCPLLAALGGKGLNGSN